MPNSIDLCVLQDVKDNLRTATTGQDVLIQECITAASGALIARYEREFTPQATATRRFPVRGFRVPLTPPVSDLRSVTSVTLHPESSSPVVLPVGSGGYTLTPPAGLALGGTWQVIQLSVFLNLFSSYAVEYGFANLDVNGAWGCYTTATVPDMVRRACVITASSWIDRAAAEYGFAGGTADMIDPSRANTWAIPNAAHALLRPWARVPV